MSKIRVLVVEDSATARAILVHAIELDARLELAGVAHDGEHGVELAKKLRPDVISMDVLLPKLDGYEATRTIMTEAPAPVVIVTSLDIGDVERSMRLLQIGAVALVRKPPSPGAVDFERACRELCESLALMAEVKVVRRHRPHASDLSLHAPALRPSSARAELVAIAASTGGPKIIAELLSELPPAFDVPILIVQHIADGFAPGFARWLSSVCPFGVRLAEHGRAIERGDVLVAPDGAHLRITGDRKIALSKDPPMGGFRPSANALFASAASAYGSASVGVILSGMGHDGVEGLARIHEVRGRVLAQDEATSLVYGMPKAAADAGLADSLLSPKAIAKVLVVLASGDRS